jgi:hypothetical protein
LYDLERRTTDSVPQERKLAMVEQLQRVIVKALEDEGFIAMSESELRTHTGKGSAELIEEVMKKMPFGRRQGSAVKPARNIFFLINEKRPRCTRDGAGAMGAYVFATQPLQDVRSDFGSIALMIVGFGECARSTTGPTRTYMNGLIEEATNQLSSRLQRM